MIQFVKKSDGISDFSDIEVGTLEKLAVNFATHWKQGELATARWECSYGCSGTALSNINTRLSMSFASPKNAGAVLQALLRHRVGLGQGKARGPHFRR